jgi:tagatose-6-phosphate ketose/aldose isomerase
MADLADQLGDLPPQLVAGPQPVRVVYVGAGPLAFVARKTALKVMALSAGKMPAVWHSTLGLRYGTKAFGPAWAAPLCVAAAKVKEVVWSNALGLNVDGPISGQSTPSHVVSGVKLYPVQL